MNPELETLDQLAGGDLPIRIIRGLFSDSQQFVRAILAMLDAGEVRLRDAEGLDVPPWRRGEALAADEPGLTLSLTDKGARRA